MKKSFSRDVSDLDAPIVRPNFIPRRGSYEIPASGSQDEPLVCFKVNASWVAHLIGVLDALDQPDAWSGTSTAIEDARGEVRKIIANMESCEEVITDIRINDCILEAFIDGVWTPKGDITGCIIAVGGDTADERYEDRPWDQPNESELPEPVDDLDCLWGGSLNLVNYLISVAGNVADLMDAAATAADALGDLFVMFPSFSRIGVSAGLGAIEGGLIITTAILRQGFAQEAKEAIACELFCLIRAANNGNTLTLELYEQWLDIVNDHFDDDPQELWSPGVSWIGDIGRDIAGRHYAFKQFQLGLNNCDDDWMILCTDCPSDEWCYTWLGGDGFSPAWSLNAAGGGVSTYDAINDRIVGYKIPASSTGVSLNITIDADRPIESIEILYSYNQTRNATSNRVRILADSVIKADVTPSNGSQIDKVISWTPGSAEYVTELELSANINSLTAADASYLHIKKITVNGQGLNPFGSDNC